MLSYFFFADSRDNLCDCIDVSLRTLRKWGNMNILVLGNGFDLALGLPTKYTDFLEFVNVIEELCPGGVDFNIDFVKKIITNAPFGCFSSNGALSRDDIINKLGQAFAPENNALYGIEFVSKEGERERH